MNQGIYKLVYSKALNMYVPVSEAVRSHSAKSSRRLGRCAKKILKYTLITSVIYLVFIGKVWAGPEGLVPGSQAWLNATITGATSNSMTITQTAPKAILDWQRLNLNAGELLKFNQQGNRTWSALNRIHDLSPSLLNGNVTADGNVYFINTNGIIFGPNAQFNVGSIYAGSLDISDDLFKAGFVKSDATFNKVFEGAGGFVTVEKGAQIHTANGGKVLLFAPKVTNNGVINTPDGQTILAAGNKIYLASSKDPAGFLVEVDSGGEATNLGKIVAERGNITMMGLAVNQKGSLSATTSVRANGSIFLQAQDKAAIDINGVPTQKKRDGQVTLSKDSVTEVTPEMDNKEEATAAQAFATSKVKIEASLVNIDGKIRAKSGNVTVTADSVASANLAAKNPNNISKRIFLGSDAEIDVSGVNAVAPMSRNQLKIELFSDQLKDAPILRDGGLFKDTVYVDARKGTGLFDIQPFLNLKGATVAEKMTNAGSVTFSAPNDVITSAGSVINVSGGSTTYEAGNIIETNLSYNGKLVPISEAKADIPYDKKSDYFTSTSKKFGITRVWDLSGGGTEGWGKVSTAPTSQLKTTLVGSFSESYLDGGNAGKFEVKNVDDSIKTKKLVLAGQLLANTQVGQQQKLKQNIPATGQLILDVTRVEIAKTAKQLTDNFRFEQSLADDYQSVISNDFIENGFNRLDIAGATVNDALRLKPQGSLKFSGATVINADIIAPSSSVDIGGASIADGVTISTAGLFTNDKSGIPGALTQPIALNGGNIKAGILNLGKNVTLDASAGVGVNTKGVVTEGKSGNIEFTTESKLDDSVALKSYGFKQGGELTMKYGSLDSPHRLNIAGNPNASETDIDITSNFFNQGGFSKYSIQNNANINIGDSAGVPQEIYATADNWRLNADIANQAGGQKMTSITSVYTQPEATRKAVSLSFIAEPPTRDGVVTLAENTSIRTDIGGSVSLTAGKQVNVLGDIITPGGTINLNIKQSDATLPIDNTQTIFIGEHANLSAKGSSVALPDSRADLLKTQVTNAGAINISGDMSLALQKGSIVIKNGAVLDVSGASTVTDTQTESGYVRETLHGDAGKVSIAGVDNLLIDGDFKATATGTGRDGTLSLAYGRQLINNPFNGILSVAGDAAFNIVQQKQLRAEGISVGGEVNTPERLGAQISAEQINQAGFANVNVAVIADDNLKNTVQLANDLDLAVAGNLKLEAPIVKVLNDGVAKLSAGHIVLKTPNNRVTDKANVTAGSGELNLQAKQLYINGTQAIAGVNHTAIKTMLDIHGAGGLMTNGQLDLTARQIYPNTPNLALSGTDFGGVLSFESLGENSKINVNSSGVAAKPVLSAQGTLNLKADDIVQNGVLSAPFGQIKLEGKNSVTLTESSVTSVSANHQIIPFWTTKTGGTKLSPIAGAGTPLQTLKDKRIEIKSDHIDLQKSAVIDLSAGGNMFAYEFVPGIGGSEDVLAKPNMYAVLPSVGNDYAPYDVLNSTSSTQQVGVGQAVYLTGVDGLASGTYTLMPARYALVPGAFLVDANVTGTKLLPAQTAKQLDGSTITTGYRADIGTGARDANWTNFKVTDGAIFRPVAGATSKSPSQYILTNFTDYFSNPLNTDGSNVSLPIDVAGLGLEANKLAMNATVVANKVAGGEGLNVDVNAKNIRVVSNVGADDGSLQLTTDSINALKADSLLLGGKRVKNKTVDEITTGAETVSIENDSNTAIKAPELIATATNNITVKTGAVVDTGNAASNTPQKIIKADGEGALLAVSSVSDFQYSRSGSSSTASKGDLNIENGSTIKAGKSVVVDATKNTRLNGNLSLQDGGSAVFGSNRILLGNAPVDEAGLRINDAALSNLGRLKSLALNSYSNVDTYGKVEFGNANLDLTIDAAGLAGHSTPTASANDSVITAQNFTLKNSQAAVFVEPTDSSANGLQINAKQVKLEGSEAGDGKTVVAGYSHLAIKADEIRVAKTGEANFNVADTQLSTGRLTADSAADFSINSTHSMAINQLADAKISSEKGLGATLNVNAKNLSVGGTIALDSGKLGLTAENDLNINHGANISAKSAAKTFYDKTEHADAGSILLKSTAANVNINSGAVVDVSSQGEADAGKVKIIATSGTTNIAGDIKGAATGTGKGGELEIDVNTLADLTQTNKHASGFSESRQYRVRTGDVNITGTGADALKARNTVVNVDTGKITVTGDIIATAPKNSRIGLYANNGVTLENTAKLEAKSTNADQEGGKVEIHTRVGRLDLKLGSKIDVGGGANGKGGDVHLRASRTGAGSGNGVAVDSLATQIVGAKSTVLEAVRTFENVTKVDAGTGTGATLGFTTIANDVTNFMANKNAIVSSLGKAGDSTFHLRAGEEIQSNGDLTIGSTTNDWNLYSATRAGDEPGVLTLRATGNIDVKGTISDGYTTAQLNEVSAPATPATAEIPEVPEVLDADGSVITPLIPAIPAQAAKPATGVQNGESWSYRIVAGADMGAANALTTQKATDAATGNISLANNKGIRTGTGDIDIAAGGDLIMKGSGSVIYTVGRNADALAGFDMPSATLNPLYLTGGGDVSIAAKGNIKGGETTTNRQLINNWLFRQGGGSSKFDTSWWVRPDLFKQSVATLGGGNVNISSNGNISNFSASAATTARYDTNGTTGNQTVDGGGDVNVKAGGDINNGVYFVAKGQGNIQAGGSIQAQNTFGTILALQDSDIRVTTGKNALVEAVINPTLVAQSTTNAAALDFTGINSYFNTYSQDAGVSLQSLQGNVNFGGNAANTQVGGLNTSILEKSLTYAPGNFKAVAYNEDVNIGSTVAKRDLNLLPSSEGSLTLLAANDVILTNNINMSDADVAALPSAVNPISSSRYHQFEAGLKSHANVLLHKNDPNPALIIANDGDVKSTTSTQSIVNVPKELKVFAGHDVNAVTFNIQNNHASDVSLIKAGNDVRAIGTSVSGPGNLLVQAGHHLDLTEASGAIATTGNVTNPALPDEGASITLQAGLGKGAKVQEYIEKYILPTGTGPDAIIKDAALLAEYRANTTQSVTNFMRKHTTNSALSDAEALSQFNALNLDAKTIFANRHLSSELLASAKGFSKAGNHNRGNNAIATLFPTLNEGDILLFKNKVSTNSGGSIDLLAPSGLIAVGAPGVSAVGDADLGIITEKGGEIRAMSNKGFEVNQSKVITQFGSDITVWVTEGPIDAGRGSKTATSIPERIVLTDADGNTTVEVRGVAAGSGIRAQSYDPDGLSGPETAPLKGKVSLIAPLVDAGEAGIEAGDLLIVAPIVLNATNIQVQGASSGVPVTASASVAGASAGLSPDAVNSVTAALGDSLAQTASQSFVKPKLPSILSVDIISIGK